MAAVAAAAAAVLLVFTPLAPFAAGDPPPAQHDPAAVRDRADDILARDEFQPPEDSLLDGVWEWIVDHLIPGDSNGGGSEGSGSEGSGGGGGGIGAGQSVFTVILFVLAAVAIGFVVRSLLGRSLPKRADRPDPVAIDVEERRSADEWASVAERHEAAGDWKEGLRCRFRALVERLIATGVVPEIPGRTSGELRADVRASTPAAADAFGEAALLFERAFYGDLDTGPDEARRFAELAAQILTTPPAEVPT